MQRLLSKTRVLVVEDEIVVSEDLQERLVELGFEVAGAADTAADAIRLATSVRPDVALMDIMLHGRPEGIDAAEHLRRKLDIPVIYLTAHSDAATLQRARLTDPSGYIVKPFDDDQLRVAIEVAPHRHAMELKARRVAHWLTATLTSIGDAVIATNPRSEILFLNPAAEKLTGWSQDDAAGKLCAEVVRLVNQITGQPLEDPAARALRHGLVIRLDPDTVLITRTGEERRVDDSASSITDKTGAILGAVLVVVDAKDRLAEHSGAQELTNQVVQLLGEEERPGVLGTELEAFAAAVNHDLHSPLQTIAGCAELLAESHREQLGASGRLFLDQVRANAQQMSRMVEDYLTFLCWSRAQPLRRDAVNLERVAQTVFADVPFMPGRKPARFVCETLPQTWGDEALLRRVLANLLDNALKYSAQREEPVVEVGAIPGEVLHTFFVRDNGTGMDLENAAKLFEPFQRFHSAADFPGTGLGLAIAKRIVERHGGAIWAESQPGVGATFFFSLPVKVSGVPKSA
jgi:two-component system, cell cycle sensor histidine kinase and response regulator CckA